MIDGTDSIIQEDLNQIVGDCRFELGRLLGRSILITGATGFVGRSLVECVVRHNEISGGARCLVTLLSRRPELLRRRYQTQVESGEVIVTPWGVENAFDMSGGPWDYIVHAASPSDPATVRRDPYSSLRDMVDMAASVSSAADNSDVRRVVLLSSGAVYGGQPEGMSEIPEDYRGGPDLTQVMSGYGEGKRVSEMLFRLARGDHRTARVFSLVGPYQDLKSSFAIPDLIRQAVETGVMQLTGDGTAARNYCYAADLSTFLFKLLLGDPRHDVYNVGCREGVATISEVADELAAIFGGLEIRKTSSPDAVSDLRRRYVPRLDRMDEVYSPRTGLRTALLRTCHSLYNRGLIDRRPAVDLPT